MPGDWPPKIEKGVPRIENRGKKWGFVLDMEPGDSIFIPGMTTKQIPGRFLHLLDKRPEYQFECHNTTENSINGVRVWRK